MSHCIPHIAVHYYELAHIYAFNMTCMSKIYYKFLYNSMPNIVRLPKIWKKLYEQLQSIHPNRIAKFMTSYRPCPEKSQNLTLLHANKGTDGMRAACTSVQSDQHLYF